MRNYNYILAKANCGIKHIQIIPNGIETRVFAFIQDGDCNGCMYKSMCNEMASAVQKKAQLEKEIEGVQRWPLPQPVKP